MSLLLQEVARHPLEAAREFLIPEVLVACLVVSWTAIAIGSSLSLMVLDRGEVDST